MAVQPVRSETSTRTYKIVIVILVLIILAGGVFFVFGSIPAAGGDKTKAEANVLDLYKVITGGNVEILKTSEQNGLYKVTVRFGDATGRDTVQDIFITKDSLFFTDRLIDVGVQKSVLGNQSAFAQCLFDKRIRIFGLSNDPATQAQLQVLGAFAASLYVDCGGQNAAICQQLNITQVPVIFYNGTLVQGPLNTDWFVQNAGCRLGFFNATQ